MGATKRLYEDMTERNNNEFMECSRCGEKVYIDFIYYSQYPDHALCECCNGDLNG